MDFSTSRVNHHNRKQFQTSAANKLKDRHCHCDLIIIQQSIYVNTADTNYRYAQLMSDAQSPNEFAADYGSTTAGGATITVETLMKIKNHEIHKNGRISKITGWLTSTKTKTTTMALMKWSPDVDSATAITPSVVHEFSITESSGDFDVVERVKETVIDSPSISEGDMLFWMVTADQTGNSFIHLSIEYTDNEL
jgi:hypothetical protein